MANNRKPLVEGSQNALQKLKFECAQDLGMMQFVKENNDHYKGDLPSRVNGAQGGPIGGEMVKRMIASYENSVK